MADFAKGSKAVFQARRTDARNKNHTGESAVADIDEPDDLPSLAISPEKVCFVIVRARDFEVRDEGAESDVDSGDDNPVPIPEEDEEDAVEEELTTFVDSMSEDEQIDLVALAWLGRGDGSIGDWADLRQQAAEAHNQRTAAYLLGIPLLPDYLEEALAAFGQSCEEFE